MSDAFAGAITILSEHSTMKSAGISSTGAVLSTTEIIWTSEEELPYNPVQPLTPYQGKMDNIVSKIESRITAIREFNCVMTGGTVQVVTIDGQEICVEK